MNSETKGQDPNPIHLQWFAEEGNAPAESKAEGGSFVAALTQDAGSPATETQADKGAGQESKTQTAPQLPGFAAGLTKELKADQKVAGYVSRFKTMDEAIRAGLEAESKVGSMVAVPGKDATPEEKAAFYAKVGLDIPEKAEGYELELDKRLDQDKEQVIEFRNLAKDLGLSKAQAKEMFRLAQEKAFQELASYRETQAAAKVEVESTLKKEWGDDYPAQTENVRRALRAYGDRDLAEAIEDTGMGNKPAFIRLLAKIGKMTREDSASARSGAPGKADKTAAQILYPGST